MASWEELEPHEKNSANKFINHWNENERRVHYPLSLDGIVTYLNDHKTDLLVSTAVPHYGRKVLAYLERALTRRH